MKLKHVFPDLTNKNPAKHTLEWTYAFGKTFFDFGKVEKSIHKGNKVYFAIRKVSHKNGVNDEKLELLLELTHEEAECIVAGLAQVGWRNKYAKRGRK